MCRYEISENAGDAPVTEAHWVETHKFFEQQWEELDRQKRAAVAGESFEVFAGEFGSRLYYK